MKETHCYRIVYGRKEDGPYVSTGKRGALSNRSPSTYSPATGIGAYSPPESLLQSEACQCLFPACYARGHGPAAFYEQARAGRRPGGQPIVWHESDLPAQ